MSPNFIVVLLAGLVPMVVGFLWYGPLFQKSWMRESGVTQEMAEGGKYAFDFRISVCF